MGWYFGVTDLTINWNNLAKDDLAWETLLPAPGTPLTPDECKSLALAVGLRGAGHVSPNPQVGCVITSADYRFVAAGAHMRFGGPHAEVEAIGAAAGLSVVGGTAWVTLEPCAHHGKTPPCAELLRNKKLARVVIGRLDPNPLVAGRGLKLLQECGIAVEVAAQGDPWELACGELAEAFLYPVIHQRIFVGLKVATSADGVSARPGDRRIWITGERARDYGHFLRMRYDAILVGPRTVVADNPTLNVRPARLHGRTPVRVVFDPEGTVLAASKTRSFNVFSYQPQTTVVFLGQNVRDASVEHLDKSVRFIRLELDQNGHFRWSDVMSCLSELGVRSLLVEGGPGVHQSALEAGVVSRLHWFRAPVVFNDASALHFAGGKSLADLNLEKVQTITLEADQLCEGLVKDIGFA